MVDFVRGAAPPPPSKRMDVFRVTTSESAQFTCASESILGVEIHWYGRRSHECTQTANGQCKGCAENWPKKWKGYLHVVDPLKRHEGFLEITATCWALFQSQLPPTSSLRGIRFRLSKTKGGAKGRYLVTVLESRECSESLPEERDALPVLRLLWNAKKNPGQTI
jgi:hypothetical protein